MPVVVTEGMRDRINSETNMPLNSLRDFVIRDENLFKKFTEALVENGEKSFKCWIQDNREALNGRFGKKLETPLHRCLF